MARESLSSATAEHARAVVETCLQLLPADARPLAVYLSGGFARGESGHYLCDGKPLPFGDYDFDVIAPRPLLDSEIEAVEEALFQRLRFQPVTAESAPTLTENPDRFNVLDLRFKTPDEFLSAAPDLALLDFLGSRVLLWGEDLVQGQLSIGIDEVSPFSPWRIVGNRITLALKHIDTDFWERAPTRHEALAFRLASCRTYLDLAGMIGFLAGKYGASYSERLAFLREDQGLWRGWFEDSDGFVGRIEESIRFKREPRLEPLSGARIWGEWFELVMDLGAALPHLANLVLLTRHLPIEKIRETLRRSAGGGASVAVTRPFQEDWRPLAARQARAYPGLFYRDYALQLLRRKRKRLPFGSFLATQASRCYSLIENTLWKGRSWTFKNLRRATLSPQAFQSAAQTLLLFSLAPDRSVRLEQLEAFDELMNPYLLMPFDFLPPARRWEASKRCFVHEMLDYRRKR
ncbi:MAG: hypothetical protein GHCLOJNM_00272 [bacterium]|nr:hypothetical protein [bacterium]